MKQDQDISMVNVVISITSCERLEQMGLSDS